jgi:hypothetical protein
MILQMQRYGYIEQILSSLHFSSNLQRETTMAKLFTPSCICYLPLNVNRMGKHLNLDKQYYT